MTSVFIVESHLWRSPAACPAPALNVSADRTVRACSLGYRPCTGTTRETGLQGNCGKQNGDQYAQHLKWRRPATTSPPTSSTPTSDYALRKKHTLAFADPK